MGVSLVALFAAALSAQSLPDGPGKDLVEAVCTSCHSTERIAAKQMTKTEWQDKVLEMLQEEPDVTQAEREKIVEYLAKTFPKRVKVNTAEAKELETGLELTAKEAEAIVRYREANGAFHSVADVKKVPGVDGAKIEARKERLEF